MKYEIIVVGGGHAGCEAALASARKGHKTLLITGNIKNIADMPCNPSIGGPAKGIVVREIDALGGEMAKNADKSLIQIKILNTKKGPAVQALRAQIDKTIYPQEMLKTLRKEKFLTIVEEIVEDLIVENDRIKGIITSTNKTFHCKVLILTTGTYLKACILRGRDKSVGGPHGEKASLHLSDKLKELGFTIQRLKTGTPPRLDGKTINFNNFEEEKGSNKILTFSFQNKHFYKVKNQEKCYLLYTNKNTHNLINENLSKSSMYGGYVTGIGPRYCPSIEDKIVKFKDKERHQLFLEPESRYYSDIYLQGFSTSMPIDIQDKMVHSLKGLESVKILKYAYAIEYDAIDPLNLKETLETKIIKNLYTAGQINGTSGYEEAACQGLIAGINASLKIEKRKPLVLKRDEAYIGVLIDDLITKGANEPYRLLTSRAEYRLLLRNDNADERLIKKGYKIGLVSKKDYNNYEKKAKNINNLTKKLKNKYLTPKDNQTLKTLNTPVLKDRISLYNLLKRNEITIKDMRKIINLKEYVTEELEEIEIKAKYDGYIKKVRKDATKMHNLEKMIINENINYDEVSNIATEAKQKLQKIRPSSIGQAMRISGVNPSDIAVLCVYLKRYNKKYE